MGSTRKEARERRRWRREIGELAAGAGLALEGAWADEGFRHGLLAELRGASPALVGRALATLPDGDEIARRFEEVGRLAARPRDETAAGKDSARRAAAAAAEALVAGGYPARAVRPTSTAVRAARPSDRPPDVRWLFAELLQLAVEELRGPREIVDAYDDLADGLAALLPKAQTCFVLWPWFARLKLLREHEQAMGGAMDSLREMMIHGISDVAVTKRGLAVAALSEKTRLK